MASHVDILTALRRVFLKRGRPAVEPVVDTSPRTLAELLALAVLEVEVQETQLQLLATMELQTQAVVAVVRITLLDTEQAALALSLLDTPIHLQMQHQ